MTDREVLEMFLSCSLDSPREVFDKFLTLKNAKLYGENDCVYVPGSRSDRVLLVAHADTVKMEFTTAWKIWPNLVLMIEQAVLYCGF